MPPELAVAPRSSPVPVGIAAYAPAPRAPASTPAAAPISPHPRAPSPRSPANYNLFTELRRLDSSLEEEQLAAERDAGDFDELIACLADQLHIIAAVRADPDLVARVPRDVFLRISEAAAATMEAVAAAAASLGLSDRILVASTAPTADDSDSKEENLAKNSTEDEAALSREDEDDDDDEYGDSSWPVEALSSLPDEQQQQQQRLPPPIQQVVVVQRGHSVRRIKADGPHLRRQPRRVDEGLRHDMNPFARDVVVPDPALRVVVRGGRVVEARSPDHSDADAESVVWILRQH